MYNVLSVYKAFPICIIIFVVLTGYITIPIISAWYNDGSEGWTFIYIQLVGFVADWQKKTKPCAYFYTESFSSTQLVVVQRICESPAEYLQFS